MNPTTENDGTLPADNAPNVTKDTKFRRGGFTPAAEIPDQPVTEAPEEDAPAEEIAENEEGQHLAEEISFEDPNAPAEEVAAASEETEEPEAEEDSGPIRIGSKTFKTQKEAWDYAQELELKSVADDAFRQGIEVAEARAPGNTPPPATTPAPAEDFDAEFYTDPKAYLAKERAKMKAEIDSAIDAREQKKALAESTERKWNEFFAAHADLGANETTRNLAKATFDREFETIKKLDTEKALKIVAEKARAQLEKVRLDLLPKKVLEKARTTASPGNGVRVTPPKTEEKTLSFVNQLRQNKGRRTRI